MGLISEEQHKKLKDKENKIKEIEEKLKEIKLNPNKENNDYLLSLNSTILKEKTSLYDLIRRPEIKFIDLKNYHNLDVLDEIIEQVEINIKYEGYIKKALKEAEKLVELENKKIPDDIDYYKVPNLASEAKQKLTEIRPTSLGQALRISGVNPADISILSIYLKRGMYE